MARTKQGVLGVFKHVDLCADAIRALKAAGKKINVYSPVPDHTIEEALGEKKSPLGLVTLIGAIAGTCSGFGLAWYTAHSYDLITGGKPLDAPIPWLVVGFEFTILLGCVTNFAIMLIMTRLPRLRRDPGYDERFTLDAFGVYVPCDDPEKDEIRKILEENGAVEVQDRE